MVEGNKYYTAILAKNGVCIVDSFGEEIRIRQNYLLQSIKQRTFINIEIANWWLRRELINLQLLYVKEGSVQRYISTFALPVNCYFLFDEYMIESIEDVITKPSIATIMLAIG